MARLIILDQLRLSVLILGGLPEPQARQIARLINSIRFRRELLHALRAVFQQHPELAKARVQITG
jgi:hypothetical protein